MLSFILRTLTLVSISSRRLEQIRESTICLLCSIQYLVEIGSDLFAKKQLINSSNLIKIYNKYRGREFSLLTKNVTTVEMLQTSNRRK